MQRPSRLGVGAVPASSVSSTSVSVSVASVSPSVGVSVSGSRDLHSGDWSARVHVVVPLDRRVSVSGAVNATRAGHTSQVEAYSPTPTGPGLGWRVRASDAPNNRFGANLVYNAPYARLTGDLVNGSAGTAVRLGAAGSVGTLGGYGFAAMPITSSFAVVRTGDVQGASVLRWNQPAAITRGDGVALVTGLGAYERNKIGIDPAELPMDVEIDATEIYVRPWPRAGAFVDFPIRRTRSALVVLHLADGRPVPLGARVTAQPGGRQVRVARRGEAWVTDLADENRLRVHWKDGSCETGFVLPKDFSSGDKLGPIVCREARQ